MRSTLVKLWCDEGGATAVEYALLAVAITGVVVMAVFVLGAWTSGAFTDFHDKFAVR